MMLRRILIIDGHPDSRVGRYIHALSKAYFNGAPGFRPVNACVVGMIEEIGPKGRGEWLAKVQELGSQGK